MNTSASPRICPPDNWTKGSSNSPQENEPRAIRWATRTLARAFNDPDWGKWHYTEGNGSFTACDSPIVLFQADGSPQENQSLTKVTCKRCLAKMRKAGLIEDLRHSEKVISK